MSGPRWWWMVQPHSSRAGAPAGISTYPSLRRRPLRSDSTGQNVYTSTIAVNPGTQTFTWNGRGNDGRLWPDGRYTLTSTAVDANKQFVAISTKVQAIVDSVDLAQDPPQLSINGQNYTLDKIKRNVRPTT